MPQRKTVFLRPEEMRRVHKRARRKSKKMSCFCGNFRWTKAKVASIVTKRTEGFETGDASEFDSTDEMRYQLAESAFKEAQIEAPSALPSPDNMSGAATSVGMFNELSMNESELLPAESICAAVGSWSTGYSTVQVLSESCNGDFTAEWGIHVLKGCTDGLKITEAKLGETGITLDGDISPNLTTLTWGNGQGWRRV